MKRYLIALGLFLPFILSAYVSPGKPTGHVNDFAKMFNADIAEGINNQLELLEKDTGVEVAIVTIDKLENETIETYAVRLFEEWGIGKKELDNGLLLLISKEDREMRIEVGYGLEHIFTDLQSGKIIDEILVPSFKSGDFDSGLIGTYQVFDSSIRANEPPYSQLVPETVSNETYGNSIYDILYVGFIYVMYLAAFFARSKSWWAGGIAGGIIGAIIGLVKGFVYAGLIGLGILIPLGLVFDYFVSKSHAKHKENGTNSPWGFGGGGHGGGSGGGGFGGFGGGRSGGGGASGKW